MTSTGGATHAIARTTKDGVLTQMKCGQWVDSKSLLSPGGRKFRVGDPPTCKACIRGRNLYVIPEDRV